MISQNWKRKRKRDPNDEFFALGSLEREAWAKRIVILPNQNQATQNEEFLCSIAGCKTKIHSIQALESHVASCHRFVCSECGITLPNEKFLQVHLTETHSPLFKLGLERRKLVTKEGEEEEIFQCVVDGCGRMFINKQERRKHLVEVHKFPESYNIDSILTRKKRHRRTKNKPETQQSKKSQNVGQEVKQKDEEEEEIIDGLSRIHVSANYRVPQSFSRRGGRNPFCHQKRK